MKRSLRVVRSLETDVRELSGVAVTPEGRVFVVDDEYGLAELGRRGRARFDERHAIPGVEGVTVSGDGRSLFLVSENTRRVHRVPLGRRGALGRPQEVGRLPKGGRAKNKGWEGIAWLGRAHNPEGRDRLVLVQEGRPRRVALFDPRDLGDAVVMPLPAGLKRALRDLSDVAVEPRSGALFILSADSSAIGIARLVRRRRALALDSVGVVRLPMRDRQTEGIAFDRGGRIYAASERDRTVRVLRLES
jgi:uncharacterized protein YjiK